MRLAATFLILSTLPAVAQQAMTGDEFDRYSRGKTLFYGSQNAPYGAEQYLTNRRVIWTYLDGECMHGEWFEAAEGLICFVYEEKLESPQCWSFFREGGQLSAQFENNPEARELVEVAQSDEPLVCTGPKVGV